MVLISKSIGEFAWDMLKEINRSKSDGNILISPASLAATLSLVLLGSKRDTALQIMKVLHFSEDGEAPPVCSRNTAPESENLTVVHNDLKALLTKLKSAGNSELKIANGLFTQLNFPILEDYLASAQELYQANLKSVDFVQDKTREDINTWVETETNGKIKNLFAPDSLGKNTSLVVVNAIYFKGKWMKMFKKENTKSAPFHVKEDLKITVPMMSQTETFNHGDIEEMDAQCLEIPYENGDYSMFIILPNKISGLPKVMEHMSSDLLLKWTDSTTLTKKKLDVAIPRFKIEESYDLSSNLKNMGMQDAFSQKANLSAISDVGLYVSKVMHKVYMEVNEEGTEAAAATGAVIVPKSLLPPRQFIVDHPCLSVIKHNATNTILFSLKLYSPCP